MPIDEVAGVCPLTKKNICLFKRLMSDFKEIAKKNKNKIEHGYVYRISADKDSDTLRRWECAVHIEFLESKSEFYVVISECKK
ncbi:MAG: hypothetical protein NC820_07765 [Candidatus Omnitrophica bacterium]|nr:hypothetical protein [Candidatus Omnitrophota bacterium]